MSAVLFGGDGNATRGLFEVFPQGEISRVRKLANVWVGEREAKDIRTQKSMSMLPPPPT